jgi:WD40 repeat protein
MCSRVLAPLFSILPLLLVGHARPAAPPMPLAEGLLPPGAIARLGTARFRAPSSRAAVQLSPDGKLIAVANDPLASIFLLDAATGKEVRRISTGRIVSHLAFSLASKIVITTELSGTIRSWNVATGREVSTMELRANRGGPFLVSTDGKALVLLPRAIFEDDAFIVFDALAGKRLTSIKPMQPYSTGAALSHDGKRLVTWGAAGFSGKYDPAERARLNETLQVWNVRTGKEIARVRSERKGKTILRAALSPNGKVLTIATHDGALTFVDVATGQRRRTVQARPGVGRHLAYSPNGKLLVAGSSDGRFMVWETKTGRRLALTAAPRCQFNSLAFPPDGGVIGCGLDGQAVVLWDMLTGKQLSSPGGHATPPTAIAFAPNARILTVARDGTVVTWGLSGRELRRQPAPPSDRFVPFDVAHAFAPGLRYLASVGGAGDVRVRELAGGEEVLSAEAGASFEPALAFSPDGKVLAAGASDGQRFPRGRALRRWNVATGEELPLIKSAGHTVAGVAFSPNGKHLAIGWHTGLGPREALHVRLYLAATGREVNTFKPAQLRDGSAGAPLLFTPDGRHLAVATAYGNLHFLDAVTGAEVRKLAIGAATVRPAFSPDGRTVAVATLRRGSMRQGQITLWDVRTGRKRWERTLPSAVTALELSPDGKVLASGHADTTVLLWNVPSPTVDAPAGAR